MQNINIQFLRAIAALSVVFYHTSAHYFVVGGNKEGNIFSFMAHIGYMGVDIFFVISGYIMWISTKKLQGIKGLQNFIFSRVTRIYPVYWIFLSFMIYFYHKSLHNFDLWGSVFLTFSSSSTLLLGVAWTLQYELYFYAFFAFLILLPRKLFMPLFIVVFIVLVGIQTYGSMMLDIYAHNKFNGMSTFWTFWTAPYILEFIFGVCVAYYFEHYRLKSITATLMMVVVLFISALYYQDHTIHASLSEGYYLPQRIFFLGLASMLLLSIAVELNLRKVQILPSFSATVGDASYSLYLAHNIILLYLYSIGFRDWIASDATYPFVWMVLIVCFIVLLSIAHYRWIENPVMRYSKNIKKKYLSE